MSWAAGTLRSYHAPASGIAFPVFSFALGGLVSSIVVVALSYGLRSPLADLDNFADYLPWIILSALIVFVPPNFLVLWAAQRIDPGRVGILLMTEVLAGTATAAMFSGQAFGLTESLGTALIVCAGLIEVLGRR
jgi:drug/metabolite transporter (DMT)-like permease